MNTNTSIDSASIANFTNLVRLGIGHQAESLIEPVDWNAIEALAERQGLLPIVVDGIETLPDAIRPPKIALLRLIKNQGDRNFYTSIYAPEMCMNEGTVLCRLIVKSGRANSCERGNKFGWNSLFRHKVIY